MDVWYQDEDAQPPVMTQGMCPNRLGSGEDSAYAVSQAYVVNMPTYVEGKLSQNKRKETPFKWMWIIKWTLHTPAYV